MRKIVIVISLIILVFALSGCNKGIKMHKSKILNDQGLPKMVHQIDKDARGGDIIIFTEEMKYPGMLQYEKAKYDFLATDPPKTVADYFIAKLDKSTLKKIQARQDEDSKWIVTWGKYSIDVIPYGGGGSLLRYKRLFDE